MPVVAVTAIGLGTALSNTTRLLDERSALFRELMVSRTRDFLAPAQVLPGFVAQRLERGELDPNDPAAVAQALRYTFGAAPQLSSVSFANETGLLVTAYREGDGEIATVENDLRNSPAMAGIVADARQQGSAAHWSRPTYIPPARMTVVSFVRPITVDGHQLGWVLATIRLDSLSRFVAELAGGPRQRFGVELFMLYDRQYVIAHKRLIEPGDGLSANRPVPLVTEVDDPVLAAIWDSGRHLHLLASAFRGSIVEADGHTFGLFHEPVSLPSDVPWLVGGYLPIEDVTPELHRLMLAAGVAALALGLAIGIAIWLARRLSRPAMELALASERVAHLDFDHVPTLRRSRLAEIDAAARAFNGMVGALQLFTRYAPAKLVRALIDRGEAAIRSERRTVTVMFTDIVGFTATAEHRSAEAAAALLNAHHTIVVGCVEAEGGTVDKLIGDGLMAFWNAPEAQPDHADRAVAAAIAIRRQLHAANRAAVEPVRTRLGIHSGPALVGNIGAPSRTSYTIVGDTVNTASRIEDLNRELQPRAEVGILISGDAMALLTRPVASVELGARGLRGRKGEVALFTLADETEETADDVNAR